MNYHSPVQRNLYYRMPMPWKNALASAYGLAQRRRRYGLFFHQHLAFLQESQYWPQNEVDEYQRERVSALFDVALRDVPYYRQREQYRDYLTSGRIEQLPILSKTELRNHLPAFYNQQKSDVVWAHTSGTTGKSLHFPITLNCFQREYAFRALHFSWSHTKVPGDRIAVCAGHPVAHFDRKRPPFWVYDRVNNWLLLSSYHLSLRTLRAYAEELDQFQPTAITGYPSSLYLLALAYKQHGRGRLQLGAAYTTSETLFTWQRAAIEDAFHCRVFDWYGNSEMCANIVECERGQRHLKAEHSYVEVLDRENRPVRAGEVGRLICTGTGNSAFPLIRYEVGDVVRLGNDQQCTCGRSGVLVDHVEGRIEDYVVAADGRLVGRLDHLFKDSIHVVEAQVVQHEPGIVTLRIVRAPGYTSTDERALRQEAALRLGGDTVVKCEYVETLPRSANGKVCFVESSLEQRSLVRSLFSSGINATETRGVVLPPSA